MPAITTPVPLISRKTSWLLNELLAERNAAADAAVSAEAVRPVIEAGLVDVLQGQMLPVDSQHAYQVPDAELDDWLSAVLGESS